MIILCCLICCVSEAHGEPFQRLILGVEKAGAEVGGAAAVDDGCAHDVRPLVEREAFGNAVIDHRLAVAVNADDLLAVDPPDRGGVGADGQAHAVHLPRAVDDSDGPEQNVGRRLAQRVGEVIEVDVVELGVHGVPGEFRVADGHLIAVMRNHGELVGEILLLDGRLDGAVGESIDADRFQQQPALDEAIGVGRFLRRCGRRQRGRRNLSRGGRQSPERRTPNGDNGVCGSEFMEGSRLRFTAS